MPTALLAATGDLTAISCIQNTGGADCDDTTPGLEGAVSVAFSPNGQHVYAASFDSDTIATFSRALDGTLTPEGCIQNLGGTACNATGGTAPGLDAASDVAVSPDGDNVYVVSGDSSAIALFDRASNGEITSIGCIQDASSSALCAGIGGSTPGLRGASALAISPDGDNVYVASIISDGIAVFNRAANGTLTPAGCIQNTGRTECTDSGGTTPGLDGAYDVAVSADGESVYVVSYVSDAIVTFDRAPNGSLTPSGCIQNTGGLVCLDTGGTTTGLDGPRAVTVSPDDDNVYVASFLNDAILVFDRSSNGSISAAGCIANAPDNTCAGLGGNTPGLDGPSGVTVSPDGESVYVASLASDAVTSFDRESDGSLSVADCIQNTGRTECTDEGGSTTPGLDGAIDAAVSPGGTSLYVTSYSDGAIVLFDRESSATTTTTTTTMQGPFNDCGDVNGSGGVTAADALAILNAAVGGNQCAGQQCVCDVAGGGSVLSSDALAALRIAVGIDLIPGCNC
ncbi:MAG: lactonase family protein [Candidatus Binatia bacterium]